MSDLIRLFLDLFMFPSNLISIEGQYFCVEHVPSEGDCFLHCLSMFFGGEVSTTSFVGINPGGF